MSSAALARRRCLCAACALLAAGHVRGAAPERATVEPRHRLAPAADGTAAPVALTFDACSGRIDTALLDTLERLQVRSTLFLTRRWIDRHPQDLPRLSSQPALYALENHGAQHLPAVVGGVVYGLQGPATLAGVEAEIDGGARAVAAVSGRAPRWYRAATARYDRESLALIERLGLRVAGYSLNADDGARASRATVAARLRRVQPGDIVLAHMNHPGSGTAAGFADALPELLARGLRFVALGDHTVVPVPASVPPAVPGAAGHRRA